MWSRAQKIVLAVSPKISSVFSLAGSCWIITDVVLQVMSKQKRAHPYHRLLLGMSMYEAAASVWVFMSTWPIPASTTATTSMNEVWAVGNTQTCTAQGFFLTLTIAVPIYNAMLAMYYMLVINYNVSDRTLRLYVEPAIHCTAFLWAFGTAIASTVLGLFNNANLWCWIAPYPSNCLDSWRYGDHGNCIRGDNAWIYRWAFYFAPLWFCILIASK
jgi:hypothetical protein